MNGLRVNESKINGSKVTNRLRTLASIAILSGAIFTIFLLPAYGQQEIDPTWYDPMPIAAAVHPAQAAASAHVLQPVVTHRYLQANNQVSQTAQNGNSRAKNANSDRSVTSAAENTRTLAANKKTTLIASK